MQTETIEQTASAPVIPAPSRFELTVLYALLGAHVVIATDAAIPSGWFPFVWFTLLGIAGLTVVRVLIALAACRRGTIEWGPWIELAGISLILILVHATDLGLRVRLFLSEKALLKQVEAVQKAADDPESAVGATGLFMIQAMYRHPPGVEDGEAGPVWIETVTGSRLLRTQDCMWAGLVYLEDGVPPNFGESQYKHLYGPWWLWIEGI